MLETIKRSVGYVDKFITKRPEIAIILGTGLGNFRGELHITNELPYQQIPGFPVSGVEGHSGKLLIAEFEGISLLVMQGRVHFYEGFSMTEIIYPIRVFHFLGIKYLILTNAAGGMNPRFGIGELMAITDHINMMPNPLIGKHVPEFGPRFPDMSEAYDKKLIEAAFRIAGEEGIKLMKGCYVAVTGPTYETPAEYALYRRIGGDAIGMSTVPEVIAARQMGMKCFGMSVITDLGIEGQIEPLTHEMVQKAASEAEPKMATIIKRLLKEIV